MKTMQFTFILVLVVALFACERNKIEPSDPKVLLTRSAEVFHNAISGNEGSASDPFNITGVTIDGDSVFVTVSYSGGCRFHSFNVIWNEKFTKSFPPSTSVIVIHEDNDDVCEALITETFSFSLRELIGPWDFESVKIDIINGSLPESPFMVVWYPSDINVHNIVIPQGDECQVEVTASTVICGVGLWDNLWFALNDSVNAGVEDAYFRKWLQPVVLADDLKNFRPVPGKKYLVGARVQNVHPYNNAIVCLAYSGPSIPVKITCIKELN